MTKDEAENLISQMGVYFISFLKSQERKIGKLVIRESKNDILIIFA